MAKSEKLVIWSDDDIMSIQDDLSAENPEMSEPESWEEAGRLNADYLCDVRANLDIQMPQAILVIGSLGLWNGRRIGYKEIDSGNIADCFFSDADFNEWYLDGRGDLCCDATHHDGTNHYLYRVYKNSATDTQIENLKEKIYCGTVTRRDITRITSRLGDKIASVYGFKISRMSQYQKV